jgi:lysophospholipid acyltransferase (LPLAT)-like uncharacterized protein
VTVASSLLAWVLRLLRITWRVRYEGPDPFASGEPFVGAVWHRNLILAAPLFHSQAAPLFHSHRVLVPVSRSSDGDLTVAVLEKLGFDAPPRGSSSRGAAAVLRRIIRSLEEGRRVAVLADGPRGPARQVKPGVLGAARASGRRLIPVGMSARPCLRFRSWDRALLPCGSASRSSSRP